MSGTNLPRPLVVLGLSGLAPQVLCLALVLAPGPYRWVALAAGCFYAAIILSFLGGLWWMAGLLGGLRRAWIYGLAVVPSLIGWACLLPWNLGWTWPEPALLMLGLVLATTPVVDRVLAQQVALPAGWLRLRVIMAGGLGALTLALGVAGLGLK